MSARSTARVVREELRAEFSALLHRLLDGERFGVTQEQFGYSIGSSPSIAGRMCDPRRNESMGVPDLAHPELNDDVALELLRWAAEKRGYVVVPMPDAERPECDVEPLYAAAKEHGEAIAAYVEGVKRRDLASLKAALRESLEAVEAMVAIRERLKALLQPRGPKLARMVPRRYPTGSE